MIYLAERDRSSPAAGVLRKSASDPKRTTSDLERTEQTVGARAQKVRADMRGAQVFVAEQFRHRSDVMSRLQKVGREAAPQGMAADRRIDPGGPWRVADGAT